MRISSLVCRMMHIVVPINDNRQVFAKVTAIDVKFLLTGVLRPIQVCEFEARSWDTGEFEKKGT